MNPGPYDLCPCGSGKKFKFCHMRKPGAQQATPIPAPQAPAASTRDMLQARMVDEGLRLHQAGQLAEAEAVYRRVLEADPRQADALHLLGVIGYQFQQYPVAIDLIGRAIAIKPEVAAYHANLGNALKDSGDSAGAERSYRQAIRLRPDYVDAMNNLGLVLTAAGRNDEAAALYRKVIALSPGHLLAKMNLAGLDHAAGRLDAAAAAYQDVIAMQPGFAQAHNNLGTVWQTLKRYADAERCYRRALELKPDYIEAKNNLGAALEGLGDMEGAVRTYNEVIRAGGTYDRARLNLGAVLQKLGMGDEAVAQFREVLKREPTSKDGNVNLGAAMHYQGRLAEALAHYAMSGAAGNPSSDLLGNIGSALQGLGYTDRAVVFFDRAIARDPQSAMAHTNRGSAMFQLERFDEAAASFRDAIACDPDHADAHANLSLVMFAQGQLAAGWIEAAWRLGRAHAFHGTFVRVYPQPRWEGQSLEGNGLLIWGEQGVGDEILTAGMYREAIDMAGPQGQVVIECAPKLVPLFQHNFANAQVVARTDPRDPRCLNVPDFQMPAMSLGRYLRGSIEAFPGVDQRAGYLTGEPAREAHWRERFKALGPGLKVGVSWRSSNTRGERLLSCTRLTEWDEIFQLQGVHFINVQYDEAANEIAEAEQYFGVKIHGFPEVDMFDDLLETAALLRALDVVISPATSVAILAAALGVPTMQMSYGPDWRRHGTDRVLWTPSAIPFERRWDESWKGVVQAIARDVADLAARLGAGAGGQAAMAAAPVAEPRESGWLLEAVRDGKIELAAREFDSHVAAADLTPLRDILKEGSAAGSFLSGLLVMIAQASGTTGEFLLYLAIALRGLGRAEESLALALAAASRLLESREAWEAVGWSAFEAKDFAVSEQGFSKALWLDPSSSRLCAALVRALDALALAQIAADDNRAAAATFTRAIAYKGDDGQTWYRLGCALHAIFRYDEAIAAYRKAIELLPGSPEPWNNLANSLRACARVDEALQCFRKTLSLNPALNGVRSNLLLTLNYAENISPVQFFSEHQQFGRRVAPVAAIPAPFANPRDPARKLRVGYISGDFRSHAVSKFIEPLLRHRDRDRFTVFCYMTSARFDEVSGRLRGLADGWCNLAGLDDEPASQLIRGDAVDILVDLAGHTALNRLPLIAQRVAPVQATFLGYPATTGVAAMDYKIVDEQFIPEQGDWQARFTETLWRLDGPMWSYAPGADMPEVAPPPCLANGFVTFGSFNSVTKIGPAALRRFARILAGVPRSRLLMMTVPGGETRTRFAAAFAAHGIDAGRVEFRAPVSEPEFWAAFAEADIALDSFPCNGGTTTFETLWMGVPLIAQAGDAGLQVVSRVAAGILEVLGLQEFIAQTEDDYVARAVALAGSAERVAALRKSLRPRLQSSPFLDHPQRTRSIERAYREMWNIWCGAEQAQAG